MIRVNYTPYSAADCVECGARSYHEVTIGKVTVSLCEDHFENLQLRVSDDFTCVTCGGYGGMHEVGCVEVNNTDLEA